MPAGPLTGVPVFDVVDVVTYSAFLAWTVVGAVIIGRRPGNRIGWLLCATGLLMLLGGCATQYALAALLVAGRCCPAAAERRRGSHHGRPCSA